MKKDILNSDFDLDSLSDLKSQNFLLEQIKKKKGVIVAVVLIFLFTIIGVFSSISYLVSLF
jgi:hypothetical protein